jgi:hypothetical protein
MHNAPVFRKNPLDYKKREGGIILSIWRGVFVEIINDH